MIISHSRKALILIALSAVAFNLFAEKEQWQAPNEAIALVNPLQSNTDSIEAGRMVYTKRCEKCHGKSGKGDGPDAEDLAVEPTDFTDREIQHAKDGELFWKIQTGKRPMPKYGNRLSEEDMWNVVNYLRTFTNSKLHAEAQK